jgi:hypothetical protein
MYDLDYFKKYLFYKTHRGICEFELRQAEQSGNNFMTAPIREEIRRIDYIMAEIKSVIDDYKPAAGDNFADERLYLRCRYIDGVTMEKTAELLNVSRNTAYRIKNKVEGQLLRKLS